MAREVQSLARGLSLLEKLAGLGGRASFAEIASRAELSPSTTHRLLATLVEEGYVARDRDNYYVLAHRILCVAASVQQRTAQLKATARRHLQRVVEVSGETANLVVLDGRRSVYVDQIEAPRVLRMAIHVGSTFPAHTSASAKAILAFQRDDVDLRYLFAEQRSTRLTRRTITDLKMFKEELEGTRVRGFAIEREELEEGISCIAAPILGAQGIAIAAVSVPGPTTRILQPNPERLGALVMECAEQITKQICSAAPNGNRR